MTCKCRARQRIGRTPKFLKCTPSFSSVWPMVSAVENVSWYRSFVRGKTRVVLAWIFAIVLVLSAREYPNAYGIILCFTGATLRFLASAYLRKDRHPAVGGPYGLTRNPLYLGTWLMAIGTAIAISNWWLAAIVSIAFAMVYHYIILDEETKLEQIFGKAYRAYCQVVPRFLPRPFPPKKKVLLKINPTKSHLSFSPKLAKENKAYEAYLTFAALMGFVTLLAFLWRVDWSKV